MPPPPPRQASAPVTDSPATPSSATGRVHAFSAQSTPILQTATPVVPQPGVLPQAGQNQQAPPVSRPAHPTDSQQGVCQSSPAPARERGDLNSPAPAFELGSVSPIVGVARGGSPRYSAGGFRGSSANYTFHGGEAFSQYRNPREELYQFVASLDNRVRPMDLTYHLPMRSFSNQGGGLGLLTDSSGLSLTRASPNVSLAGRQVASRSLLPCI